MVTIAVPKERAPGERRVALVPEVVARLVKQGARVRVERGAGEGAYYPDALYREAGAELAERGELLKGANLLFTVQPPSEDLIQALEPGAIVVGFVQAHKNVELVRALAAKKATVIAMELIPRITRAQSMDALSSQATVAGYLAAIHAARLSPPVLPHAHHGGGHHPPRQGDGHGGGGGGAHGHRHRQALRGPGLRLRRAEGGLGAGPLPWGQAH